jgi:hypothetical protein
MLFVAQRRAFGRRAGGDETVAALFDVPFDERFQRLEIHVTVAERGDERGDRAFEHGIACRLVEAART